MTWNHRLVRRSENGETWYGIHEAFYDKNKRVRAITKDPIDVIGESVEEVRETLQRMLRALEAPILDYEAIPEPGAEPM